MTQPERSQQAREERRRCGGGPTGLLGSSRPCLVSSSAACSPEGTHESPRPAVLWQEATYHTDTEAGSTWPELVTAVALLGGLDSAPPQQAFPGLSTAVPASAPSNPRVRPVDPGACSFGSVTHFVSPTVCTLGTCIMSTGRSTGVLGLDSVMWCHSAASETMTPQFLSP